MARYIVMVLLVGLVAAGLVACGGGQSSRPGTGAHTATSRHSNAAPGSASGKVVFTSHCSMCHSLTGHDNPRLQGGDLLGFHAHRGQVVQFVREMPMVRGPLNSDELKAVVDYVIAAEQRSAR